MSASLPNLVVIGAQKCGTSSLHNYLDLHPEVAMSQPKELNFFFDGPFGNWSRGVDWYARHFPAKTPLRGESSVNYTNLPASEGTAQRMHGVIPEAKLIYMVRDPIERLISHYIHRQGFASERRSIDEVATDGDDQYVMRSRYWTQLEPFLRLYGEARILVASQEELLGQRAATLRKVFAFLGVDPEFTSPGFEQLWERSAGKGRKYRLALRARLRLGRYSWARLPPRLRWTLERAAYAPLGRGVERPQLSEAVRAQLAGELRGEVARLEQFAGGEFEGWSVRP